MEGFLKAVAEMIECFGLQTFFYLKDSSEKMKYFPDKPHNCTIKGITTEHNYYLMESAVVNNSTGDKTPESVLERFRCYDL